MTVLGIYCFCSLVLCFWAIPEVSSRVIAVMRLYTASRSHCYLDRKCMSWESAAPNSLDESFGWGGRQKMQQCRVGLLFALVALHSEGSCPRLGCSPYIELSSSLSALSLPPPATSPKTTAVFLISLQCFCISYLCFVSNNIFNPTNTPPAPTTHTRTASPDS